MSEAYVLVESFNFAEEGDGWRVEATVIDHRGRKLRIPSLSEGEARTIKAAMDEEESRFGPLMMGATDTVPIGRLPVSCLLPLDTIEGAEPVAA